MKNKILIEMETNNNNNNKYNAFNVESNITGTIICNSRIYAILYIPETWFQVYSCI